MVKKINQLLIIYAEGNCGWDQVLNQPKIVVVIGLIMSDRGLITSDRIKRFPAQLPIGERI